MKIAKRSEKGESKNRPVATNFQFLKMLCPSGTALLQRSRVLKCSCWGVPAPDPAGNEYGKREFLLFYDTFNIAAINISLCNRIEKWIFSNCI
ncbi:MAG: hypothetical protein ACLTS5_04660, partial [Faecalibacterium prausnitzii]